MIALAAGGAGIEIAGVGADDLLFPTATPFVIVGLGFAHNSAGTNPTAVLGVGLEIPLASNFDARAEFRWSLRLTSGGTPAHVDRFTVGLSENF